MVGSPRDERSISAATTRPTPTARFQIRKLKFEVQTAKLKVFFPGRRGPKEHQRVAWGVVVQAFRPGRFENWEPCFAADQVLETGRQEMQSWRQLAGRRGAWRDEDGNEERALLTTFEHEPVINAEWRFDLSSSGRLIFTLDGFSRFAHSRLYKGMLPIRIRTELAYAPIAMGHDKESTCRKQLAGLGIADRFKFRKKDRVSYLVPLDYPQPPGALAKRARTEF